MDLREAERRVGRVGDDGGHLLARGRPVPLHVSPHLVVLGGLQQIVDVLVADGLEAHVRAGERDGLDPGHGSSEYVVARAQQHARGDDH